ncbi:hypothetical protein MCOR25_010105 [Pyricularia grisea]|uniref:Cytochrome P450 n=1 Tax=Pyricularia grisea TaxID=148305 RepID=A0A6P8ATV7_PYRGI|nr:uncharacterized protein PgNI_09487 [Pyricularia grisea]KAI6351153.1 hypothetical protein MCOR25_010105 [Pyricularia grisea]TLD05527.1 hypothetical protein PgNI_09487 [Pyricularia grisea]
MEIAGCERLLLGILLFSACSVIVKIIYRLYFHPLARFPGPRFVAATSLLELYWDMVGQGAYLYRIEQMHQKYGPIVRVNPQELSIKDPSYYDQLYVAGAVRRTNCWTGNGGMEFKDSHGTTVEHDHHRLRRKPMEPYFSRAGISRIEPVLKRIVQTLVDRLDQYKGSGNVISLDCLFSAFSGDVITAICVGDGDATSLRHPSFDPEWILMSLPERFLEKANPEFKRLNEWRNRAGKHIMEAMMVQESFNDASDLLHKASSRHATLFHQLLSPQSGLPDSERSIERLTTEAQVLLGAGTVTTTRTLSYLITHILLQDSVKITLERELRAQAVDLRNGSTSLADLEKLQYLQACVKEGLRQVLSFGFMVRLPRCSPDVELRYGKWTIPKGVSGRVLYFHQPEATTYSIDHQTPVGMSAYLTHTDPTIFAEPHEFRPERWLEGQVTPAMKQAYVPFSKGSRACLGSNLAYAELLMLTAALFQPGAPPLVLWETSARDVDPFHAYLLPMPRIGGGGAKVLIR